MTERPESKTGARLAEEIARFNRNQFTWWRTILWQLIRGLAFGLGSVLGASILVSLVVWWLSQFEFIPVIGEWVGQIAKEIEGNQ